MVQISFRIIFTGGGTGGHIFPALALARYLRRREPGVEILFVGARGGMEEKLVPEAGFKLCLLPVQGLPRSLSPRLVKATLSLLLSLREAGALLHSFQPHAVIGTGGYAAGPVMLRAILRGCVTLLHEQNLVPGLTNRLLAPFVDRVCLSFPESKAHFPARVKSFYTGNPRASEISTLAPTEAKKMLHFNPQKPLLVVVGGSRGAAVLNRVFLDYLIEVSEPAFCQVFYITGSSYYETALSRLQEQDVFKSWRGALQVLPFYQDMPLVWSAADLVVCRSGATTLAEITAAGVPALLVPSPNVVNDHQHLNAQVLKQRGAALVLQEEELTPLSLAQKIEELLRYPVLLREMSCKSLALGVSDAAERVYSCLMESIRDKKGKL